MLEKVFGDLYTDWKKQKREKAIEEENRKAIELEEQRRIQEEKQSRFVTNFTFDTTGVLHRCEFGDMDRQTSIIMHANEGDPVILLEYEYAGRRALAVIDNRTHCDVGVVPAKLHDRIFDYFDNYDKEGTIIEKYDFTYRSNEYVGVKVRFQIYKHKLD